MIFFLKKTVKMQLMGLEMGCVNGYYRTLTLIYTSDFIMRLAVRFGSFYWSLKMHFCTKSEFDVLHETVKMQLKTGL